LAHLLTQRVKRFDTEFQVIRFHFGFSDTGHMPSFHKQRPNGERRIPQTTSQHSCQSYCYLLLRYDAQGTRHHAQRTSRRGEARRTDVVEAEAHTNCDPQRGPRSYLRSDTTTQRLVNATKPDFLKSTGVKHPSRFGVYIARTKSR
jgi:hypothetical protein